MADHLVVVPHGHLPPLADANAGRGAGLLAEIETLPVSDDEVALDHAIRAAGEGDAGLRAPGPGGLGKPVADNHVVVGLQAKGDLVENAAVLVVSDQALAHGAMLVADVEPDATAAVAHEPAAFEDGVAAQHQLVAARFPAAVETFGVVVLHPAFGEQQVVGAIGAEAQLAVVAKDTPADDLIFAGKGRPAGVHLFDRRNPRGRHGRPPTRPPRAGPCWRQTGSANRARAPIAFHAENLLPDRGLDKHTG